MIKPRIAAILMSAVLLCGCYASSEKPSPTPSQSPEPTPSAPASATPAAPANGGEITLSMRIPKTLNPLLNSEKTVDLVLKLLFEPLAYVDEYQKPVANAALAERIEYAADGTSVLVTLRSGAEWSDGTPVTAKDVEFSVNTIRTAPDTSIYKNCTGNISSVGILDERSVKISLVQPFGGTPYTMCFPVIPEHYYKTAEAALDGERNMQPLGNGLYTFDSYTVTDGMKLTASERAAQGRPYIDKVAVLVTPDAASDLTSADQKIISVVSAGITDWGKYSSSPEFRTEEYLTSYFDFIGFNFDRELSRSVNFRRAVAHATPVDEIIETVYQNNAVKASTPISPASWLFESSVTQYAFDMAEAKTLMPVGEYSLLILVNAENAERVKIAAILRDNLLELGINAEIDEASFEDYMKKLDDRNYDIFVGGYSLSVIPDLTFAFHSSRIAQTGGNYFNYASDTMDMLLQNCFKAENDESYRILASDLQKYIAADLPLVGIGFRKSAVVADKKINGDLKPSLTNPYQNLKNWFVTD